MTLAEKQKKYHASGEVRRAFCDCGRPATIMLCRVKVCQRCYEIDKRKPAKEEKSDDWKLSYQWDNSDVKEACTKWLKEHGVFSERGFGRIEFSGERNLLDRL